MNCAQCSGPSWPWSDGGPVAGEVRLDGAVPEAVGLGPVDDAAHGVQPLSGGLASVTLENHMPSTLRVSVRSGTGSSVMACSS